MSWQNIIKKKKVGELNLIAKQYYEKIIRNDVKVTALQALNKHKKKGDKIVVVSASLEILLQFFCKDHGLDLIAIKANSLLFFTSLGA